MRTSGSASQTNRQPTLPERGWRRVVRRMVGFFWTAVISGAISATATFALFCIVRGDPVTGFEYVVTEVTSAARETLAKMSAYGQESAGVVDSAVESPNTESTPILSEAFFENFERESRAIDRLITNTSLSIAQMGDAGRGS